MARTVVLVTGSNGEIGKALLRALAEQGESEIVAIDLTPLPESLRTFAVASYTGNIMDRYLLDQIAAHHDIDVVFHLAALLSTRSERDPELAHQVNVEGTLNVLRAAQNQSARLARPVRFVFPSSIAVYGLPSLERKRAAGRVREEEWNVPITMYGCNKLYCENVGRYFAFHARQMGALASATRLDFRALRFPGLISADTVPAGGTSDFGPEMIHAAAKGLPYECFVEPEARIPFMATPDAVRALLEVAFAPRQALSSCVYNIGGFSLSAEEIRASLLHVFPDAAIGFAPDPVRAKIVASWPEDVEDEKARTDWAWRPSLSWEGTLTEYLAPALMPR